MRTDTRKTPRKILHVPGVVRWPARPALEVRTLDVGMDGLSLASSVAIPANLECTVEFLLPLHGADPAALSVRARVVYSVLSHDNFKIGLRFLSLSADAQAALSRYQHG